MRTSRQHRRPPQLEPLEDRSVPAAYALTDLGVVGIWNSYDVNEAGQVVGTSVNAAGQSRAFLWDDGVLTDLGTLGGDSSWAGGLNDAGQVVGHSRVAPGSSATEMFLWEDGVMTSLGVSGASPSGINNAGQVIGSYTVPSFHGPQSHAFLWDDGVVRDLFSPGVPTDVNEAGQVAAVWESTRGYPAAALWDPQIGGVSELPVFFGSVFSGAYALNDVGQIVGYADHGDEMARPVLWDDGQIIDLGTLGPAGHSYAYDVNNAGQVVGSAGVAFVWQDGVMEDLNDLVPTGSGLTLWYAMAINDAGQIVAVGVDARGVEHAVLLSPLPEDAPLISIGDVTVTEGHTGTRTAAFTVTLSTASSEPVTVAFATADGTATAGSDYHVTTGSLTFAPGETSKTIAVPVNGDRSGEPNETFVVNLTRAAGGIIIGDGQGVGTIVDDEPRVSINNVTRTEGRSGTTLFTFLVTLSAASDVPVTVNFATANGTATAGGDYDARSGTITFAPGETSKEITVAVKGDRQKEADETFFVDLSSAIGALIEISRGRGTILDDDRR
jgi:probable HAF family extracellular repeat protein